VKALDLLGQSRQISRWLSLGIRRDELTAWQGGILPTLTAQRWLELMPAHALAVQAQLEVEAEGMQPGGGHQEPLTEEPIRRHGVLR
jgi:hypothetical protein